MRNSRQKNDNVNEKTHQKPLKNGKCHNGEEIESSSKRTGFLRRKRRDINENGRTFSVINSKGVNVKAKSLLKSEMKSPSMAVVATQSKEKEEIEEGADERKNKKFDSVKKSKRIDEYGFIVNLDSEGHLHENGLNIPGGAFTPSDRADIDTDFNGLPKKFIRSPTKSHRRHPNIERQKRRFLMRREKKWIAMLKNWKSMQNIPTQKKIIQRRVRKGIPNVVRGTAWARIGNVPAKMNGRFDVYSELVTKSTRNDISSSSSKNIEEIIQSVINDSAIRKQIMRDIPESDTESISALKDTIERDINRTFPRHHMFYNDTSDSESESIDDASLASSSTPIDFVRKSNSYNNNDLGISSLELSDGHNTEVVKINSTLSWDSAENKNLSASSVHRKKIEIKKQDDFAVAEGGPAILRRVLRAYSFYDEEVGYCQGMNFIAAMFITYMSEEEAFWLLVNVMNEPPCRMRGLFDLGMSESLQVLYVAEKLIAQFNPKLYRHFEKEHVDTTMFASQWLITLYTSSFPFDIVVRVWDCFLMEGWKVIYRVMLALLEKATPDLLKLQFEDILGYLKELPNMVEGLALIESAYKVKLKKRHLVKYANEWAARQP